MTDARTEARRRIAVAIEFAPACRHETATYPPDRTCPDCLADAVLDLFPTVNWMPAFFGDDRRGLVLYGPVEPVVPEEPQP